MYMAKRNLFGLIYDDKTGKVTYDDGEIPSIGGDFTFEFHEGYNPLQFATDKTGEKLLELLKAHFGSSVINFSLAKTAVSGPVAPPAALQVVAERNGISESFNAGLIANSLIRTGSFSSFRFDLKVAGILF